MAPEKGGMLSFLRCFRVQKKNVNFPKTAKISLQVHKFPRKVPSNFPIFSIYAEVDTGNVPKPCRKSFVNDICTIGWVKAERIIEDWPSHSSFTYISAQYDKLKSDFSSSTLSLQSHLFTCCQEKTATGKNRVPRKSENYVDLPEAK